MLQTSLLLMKSLNKAETPIFLSVMCSLFPRAIFLTFIICGPWTVFQKKFNPDLGTCDATQSW